MHIVEASAADLSDVLAVERLAFGGEIEAGLVAALLSGPTARPLLSLLARADDRPVGHILFTTVRLQGAASAPGLPSWRRWRWCPMPSAKASAAA